MAHAPRLNRVIDRLAADKPAFGTVVPSGALNDMAAVTDAGYDFVMVENEHVGMDFPNLRASLQGLLSRRRIADQGNLQAQPTPLVRVSPNSSEVMHNQWVIKQTLDHGAYGIILPRMESVEQAQAAVVASRYVQRTGAADADPRGDRGWGATHGRPLLGPRLPSTTTTSQTCGLWTPTASFSSSPSSSRRRG